MLLAQLQTCCSSLSSPSRAISTSLAMNSKVVKKFKVGFVNWSFYCTHKSHFFQPTRFRTKPLTYQQNVRTEYLGHHQSWFSWHTRELHCRKFRFFKNSKTSSLQINCATLKRIDHTLSFRTKSFVV